MESLLSFKIGLSFITDIEIIKMSAISLGYGDNPVVGKMKLVNIIKIVILKKR